MQVHHTFYYKKQIAPWLYPDDSLLTLCEKCHKDWHLQNENIYKEQKRIKRKRKLKVKNKKLQKEMSLKELYKIWEPKMKKKGVKYTI